jgi:AcrR family transcriptional regulator
LATVTSSSKSPRARTAGAKGTVKRKRNRAGRPTAGELERRKLCVMEVATDMFVTRGYAATTLLDIARQAGVATRTLYQHFGDKEDLFREVVFARPTAIVNPPVLEQGEDLLAALRKAGRYCYEVALRPRSIDLMRLMIAESGRFPELMSTVATKIFARFTGNIAALFRQLSERGLIPDDDHDLSAELFADLLLGNRTVMIYFGWASAMPTDENIEAKVRLFVHGRLGGLGNAGPAARARKPAV